MHFRVESAEHYQTKLNQNNNHHCGTLILDNEENQELSTAAAARKFKISRDYLFHFLASNDYLVKLNGKYQLTSKGANIGGLYRTDESGNRWPVWPARRLFEIIEKVNWAVDISKGLKIIKKQSRSRLLTKNADIDLLHSQLERGTKILDSEDELDTYIWSYFDMHSAKLDYAYEELDRQVNLRLLLSKNNIQIIDYACGQGLASIVFIEYLRSLRIKNRISKAILIDPSKSALEKCAEFFTGNIVRINKHFDQLCENDIYTNNSCTKLHLFSNTLDMGDKHFDLERLAGRVLNSQKGLNYFVCVGVKEREKMVRFMNYFLGHTEISSFSGELQRNTVDIDVKPWHIVGKIFKVDL